MAWIPQDSERVVYLAYLYRYHYSIGTGIGGAMFGYPLDDRGTMLDVDASSVALYFALNGLGKFLGVACLVGGVLLIGNLCDERVEVDATLVVYE